MEFCKSAYLDDWFTLDGACWAIPEGFSVEWRQIAAAMREGRDLGFCRVAVEFRDGRCTVFSPRNSTGKRDRVTIEDPGAMADKIERVLACYAKQGAGREE